MTEEFIQVADITDIDINQSQSVNIDEGMLASVLSAHVAVCKLFINIFKLLACSESKLYAMGTQ